MHRAPVKRAAYTCKINKQRKLEIRTKNDFNFGLLKLIFVKIVFYIHNLDLEGVKNDRNWSNASKDALKCKVKKYAFNVFLRAICRCKNW